MGTQSPTMIAAKKRIKALYREGKTTAEIAQTLNSEGVRTRLGTEWNTGAIAAQLRSVGIRHRRPSAQRAPGKAAAVKKAPRAYKTVSSRLDTIVSILEHETISAQDRIAMALIFAKVGQ